MNELKGVQTRQRGDIAWLSWNGSMLALKWKDRKEIFALSTIRSSQVPRAAPRVRDNENGSDTTVTRRGKRKRTAKTGDHIMPTQGHGGSELA